MAKHERVQSAQRLLTYLQEKGIAAVICGGYARDTFFCRDIRDVDVYVSEDDYTRAAGFLFGNEPYLVAQSNESDPAYLHQCIVKQSETQLRKALDFGLPTRTINLIGLTSAGSVTVEDITSRYNLGICKVGIDANGIQYTADFMRDWRDSQITLLRTDWGHEATLKQFIKLWDKYPFPMRVEDKHDCIFD